MKILVGDIWKSRAQTIVNTVNCVGVMGKGIALEFKKRFPDMFRDYVERCERGEVRLGEPYLYRTLVGPQLINFPTKDHWKSVSKASDIERGVDYIVGHYKKWNITSIAIAPLGCGNGQLDWKVIGPLIYSRAKQMDIPVEIYAPFGTSPMELTVSFLEGSCDMSSPNGIAAGKGRPVFNPAWLGLVEILERIEQQPYHYPVGRTMFQKIAYIATQEGLPTGFTYRRGSFGPFSNDVKPAITKMSNSNLLQEERLGRMFEVRRGPAFTQVKKRYSELLNRYDKTISKTTDLFMRVDTAQSEVIATVIFAAGELKQKTRGTVSEMDVLESVMEWKQKRKPPLDKTVVASAIRNLGMLGWLDIQPDLRLPLPADAEVYA